MMLNEPVPGRDYEVLAGYLGYSAKQLSRFKQSKNPADAILFHWATQPGNGLDRLIEILKKMKRHDVVETLERKGNSHFHCKQQSKTQHARISFPPDKSIATVLILVYLHIYEYRKMCILR